VTNANIGVYLNDNAVTKTTIGGSAGFGSKDQYQITHEMVGENARIKIILSPTSGGSSLSQDSGGGATAKLTVFAMANKWVDACMDRNFCLKKLGDGSATAFELRNSNLRQYECLEGNPVARLATVCSAWRACFASQTGTSYEAELLKFLKAVFKKAPTSLVQTKLLGKKGQNENQQIEKSSFSQKLFFSQFSLKLGRSAGVRGEGAEQCLELWPGLVLHGIGKSSFQHLTVNWKVAS